MQPIIGVSSGRRMVTSSVDIDSSIGLSRTIVTAAGDSPA
jgi:hypothetical protein